MSRVPINDLDDPRIQIYRSLKATNETRRLEQFVVEGERLVGRLLASEFPIISVLMTDRHESKLLSQIPESVPAFVLPHELVDALVGFPFHRGVLACGLRLARPSLDDIVKAAADRLTLVICPKLSDPENLGAIARIGDVFGVDAILGGPTCPDPFSRRVLRVSMGAVLSLPVVVSARLEEVADELACRNDVEFLGAVADPEAEPFDLVARPPRLGLVLGDEHEGIDSDWLGRCRRKITIPMRFGASSLNVAVAAGILIQHLTRNSSSVQRDR
jgi:tRNA G18 (ribose-2'-O)-methylase SpoU